MPDTKKISKNLWLHFAAWFVWISIGVFKNYFLRKGFTINIADIIFTELPNIYTFYLQFLILKKFFHKKKIVQFIFAEIIFISSYYFIAYLDAVLIAPLLNPHQVIQPLDFERFIITGFWVSLIYTFFATGYYFATTSIQKEKNLRLAESERRLKYEENLVLQAQNIRLEKEAIEKEQRQLKTEYAFLRSQINPHFLHNTLNFFYSKSLTGNTNELSAAILTLSEIMRYSLQKEDSGTTEVPLNDEIEHIQNVIKINQLRFNNSLNIIFSITGHIENIRVIPLVLITLVENAFKHGELNNAAVPLQINITVCENSKLEFTVINKKKTGPKELSHGIGINNIRRRLDIAYPKKYQLITEDGETMYKALLNIEFNTHQEAEILPNQTLNEH